MAIIAAVMPPLSTREPKSLFLIGLPMLNCSLAVMSNQAKKPAAEANFEQAMKRLEEIVEKMESGDLPLEDLIVRYEEGMKLVKSLPGTTHRRRAKDRNHHPQQCRQTTRERI